MFLKKAFKHIPFAKRIYRFIKAARRKDPEYLFFSVETARRRARREQPEVLLPRIASAYRTSGSTEITTVENIVAIPLREGVERDYSGGLVSQATGTLIPEAIHLRSDKQLAVFAQELPGQVVDSLNLTSLPEIKAVVLYGGLLYDHFGHFMLESLGRLWAYEKVKHLDPYIFFLLAYDPPEYLASRNFAYQVFKGFGIPLEKILFVKEPTRLRAAVIPGQKYGYAHLLRPGSDFVDFVRDFRFETQLPEGLADAEKVYVSRSALKAGAGKAVGENLFEDYLKTQGYAIFHPEKHTLYQQLSVYSNAGRLVFLDGSALHSCILLPDLKAEVAVIARRTEKKYDITTIVDQFRGYGQKVNWIDCVKTQYQFGLESWQAIGVVDWAAVSSHLLSLGFVNRVMDPLDENMFEHTLQHEVQEHVQAISSEPGFVNYMVEQNKLMEA